MLQQAGMHPVDLRVALGLVLVGEAASVGGSVASFVGVADGTEVGGFSVGLAVEVATASWARRVKIRSAVTKARTPSVAGTMPTSSMGASAT